MQPLYFIAGAIKYRASGRLQRCVEETCHAGMTRTSQQIRQGVFDNTVSDIRRNIRGADIRYRITQYHQAFRQRHCQ